MALGAGREALELGEATIQTAIRIENLPLLTPLLIAANTAMNTSLILEM